MLSLASILASTTYLHLLLLLLIFNVVLEQVERVVKSLLFAFLYQLFTVLIITDAVHLPLIDVVGVVLLEDKIELLLVYFLYEKG